MIQPVGGLVVNRVVGVREDAFPQINGVNLEVNLALEEINISVVLLVEEHHRILDKILQADKVCFVMLIM